MNERDYNVKMNFRTTNNPKPAGLALRGSGREKKLLLSPNTLSLPAVRPYGGASESTFSLINPTDYPLEVYIYIYIYYI